MSRAFISVGSNIEPETNVKKALRLLAQQVQIVRISTVYHTVPELRPEQPWYYNCVVEIDTGLRPEELKYALLRRIEGKMGRVRTADKFAARPIDLDLILYGDPWHQTGGLFPPDPEIVRRPFLAAALQELCPGLRLPGAEMSVEEAASNLSPENAKVLEDYTQSLRKEIACAAQC